MRIMHLLNELNDVGNGIVNLTVDLACEQRRTGHVVAIASVPGDLMPLLQAHGVEHYAVAFSKRPGRALRGLLDLQRAIRAFRPEIVHSHMMTGALMSYVLRPTVRFKTVATVHNLFQRSFRLMLFADRVIAVSDAVAHVARRCASRPSRIVTVLTGCLGGVRSRQPQASSLELARPAIMTAAGMYARKGIGLLIDAFDLVADAHPTANLYLLGAGPEKEEFERLAAAKRHSARIHFAGYVRDPRPHMRQADIFVLASFSETFGLVLTEARAEGCAIVASDVGGIPEALSRRKAGILVPPGSVEGFAAALRELLGSSEALKLWKERATQGLDEFTVSRMSAETDSVYLGLVGRSA